MMIAEMMMMMLMMKYDQAIVSQSPIVLFDKMMTSL